MDFWGDERGQPVQIGFILLFGILVLAFAGYQGYVVPNQNSQVEFQHSQESLNEMQTFREDFLGAAEDERRFSAGFTLGTDYQPRLIALNPPPVSGKLRTEQPGNGRFYLDTGDQSLAEVCGVEQDGGVPSKALVYQPSYNEYQNSPRIVYENTVTYNRFSRNDAVTVTTEQTLIQGTDILIPPLVGEVSEDGTERHTVDLYPGKAGVGEASGSGMTLTVPTELGVEQWESLLEDEMGEDGKVESVSPNGSNVDIALKAGSYDITCPVIGVGSEPDNQPSRVRGSGTEINPAAPENVRLIGSERSGDVVTLNFRNSGEIINITEARLNFYEGQGTEPTEAVISDSDDPSATLVIGSEFKELEPIIPFEGETTSQVELDFNENTNPNDWFVMTVVFETGEQGLYFVGMDDEFDDGNTDNPVEGGASIQNTNLNDNSDTGSPNKAKYDLQVQVNQDPSFRRIEVTFGGESDTTTLTGINYQQNYNFNYEGKGGTAGDEYEIIIELIDSSGDVTDRETTADTADGTNP